MDVFFQDAVQLLVNHHEINEQVLTDLVMDLAESFQVNWNEEEGLLHGCMEFILQHVDENVPVNVRRQALIQELSLEARSRLHYLYPGFDMGPFLQAWHFIFATEYTSCGRFQSSRFNKTACQISGVTCYINLGNSTTTY